MTREEVIRQIVRRDVENLGLTEDIVRQDAPGLHVSACGHFSTWDTALTYAGVDVRPRKQYTRERVIQELRTLCTSGYGLSAAQNQRRDRKLYEAAREQFGTWKKALRAAGINLERAFARGPRKHNKQEILEQIKQRHQAGLSLVWRDVCLENRAFARTAKHAFGSWRKALIAAGIDPELHRNFGNKSWDQQRVIDCLRERLQEGKSLKCVDVRQDDRSLVNAAHRYFGSWGKAIRAAGLESE